MDTKPLERFCPWARSELIDAVDARCLKYGLDDAGRAAAPADSDIAAGRVLEPDEKRQRRALYPIIEEMGYEAFCEREAYTWFNRFVAIRFMELNGYLSNHVRMLSASDGSFDPECLRAIGEINLPELDRDKALDLAAEGNDEELFRLILLAQCNELAQALPNIFGQVKEADALTLPDGLKTPGEHNVLQHLVTDIPEVDENGEHPWGHIEILGWMYQFYNAEVKAEFFKSKRKAEAKDIAPATQLFTPEWIVRYMVDNSLGRLWMLNFPDSRLRECATNPDPDERLMEYYIEPDEEHEDFIRISGPEETTFCDPACGSGHILVYAFKMLFAMYEERGYRSREIPELILTKNLSGMEIDERAAQIAELCLSLCARKHDRRFFTRGVTADITVLKSIVFDEGELPETSAIVSHRKQDLLDGLAHLSEVGSLLAPNKDELGCLLDDKETCAQAAAKLGDAFTAHTAEKLAQALATCERLNRRYDVVVANPPYMGSSSFNPFMTKWMKKRYPNSCKDLCTAFIERGYTLAEERGYSAMVTMQSWMFLGSFEKMRKQLIDEKHIVTMAHLGPRAFDAIGGEVVSVMANVLFIGRASGKGSYIRLVDIAGSEPKREKLLEAIQNTDCGYFYRADATTFHDIPGSPIAFWASEAVHSAFKLAQPLDKTGHPRVGIQTGKNAEFLRLWWEVSNVASKYDTEDISGCISSKAKWFPYNKGGDFRKWYGNNDFVIDWQDDGKSVIGDAEADGRKVMNLPPQIKFKPSITWSKISSGSISFRYKPAGHLFDVAGTSIFAKEERLAYLQGAVNSSTILAIASILSPTLNFEVGQIATYPILEASPSETDAVISLVNDLRIKSKTDWDSQETSWDFKHNSLIKKE